MEVGALETDSRGQRINHACNPNSFVLFSRAGISMAIKAYRDIEEGEEISISCTYAYYPLP